MLYSLNSRPAFPLEEDYSLPDLIRLQRECRGCALCIFCIRPVPIHENEFSRVMIVGESPGPIEDEHGIPFHPNAPGGRIMAHYMSCLGLGRSDVIITNSILCRPTGHTVIHEDAVFCASLWKNKEIAKHKLVQVIFTLGDIASKLFLPDVDIKKHMGKGFKLTIDVYGRKAIIFPLYHPGYLLRRPSMRNPVFTALDEIRKEYGQTFKYSCSDLL